MIHASPARCSAHWQRATALGDISKTGAAITAAVDHAQGNISMPGTVFTCLSVNPTSRQQISTRHGIQLLVSEPCLRQRSSARHGIQRWCRPCSGAGGDSSSSFCRSSCSARHSSCSGQHNRACLLNQVVKDSRVLPCFSVALYSLACL